MPSLQAIGTYETKTHLAEILRRVGAGQGFTITQRGEPVAELLPTGSSAHRVGAEAASRMRRFMREAPQGAPVDIKALMNEGRD